MLLTMMTAILFALVVGVLMIFAFFIGAKTAQKADRGEEIEIPSINPMEIYQRHIEQREEKKVQDELETNMYNINNYTGDSTGQKDFN